MKSLLSSLLATSLGTVLLGVAPPRPNIVLIVADDMGFSDIGCYGSEIATPQIDRLAREGLRFTQFYNATRCCPSRASLLTGLYPHQTGIGNMVIDQGLPGYRGDLNESSLTIPQVLRSAGYATYMSGKWHLTKHTDMFRDWLPPEQRQYVSKHNWPLQRGFDHFYGTIHGAGSFFAPSTLVEGNEALPVTPPSYYYTDAISAKAVEYLDDHAARTPAQPFFIYVAYTAPHWPLHALPEDIARYQGRYDRGWDVIRQERLARQRELGLAGASDQLSPRDPQVPAWSDEADRAYYARCMEVYAAQMESMDRGIGEIMAALRRQGVYENTMVLFLSDNGGCAEVITERWPRSLHIPTETRDGRPVSLGRPADGRPGAEDTYASYGVGWANASNTPFRYYKHYVHEGGIATPLVVSWPAGLPRERQGQWTTQVGHVKDIMPTLLELTGAAYPREFAGHPLTPLEGISLVPALQGGSVEIGPLFWEHHGNRGMRDGDWKLVARAKSGWELYDFSQGRDETADLSKAHPEKVAALARRYQEWADRVGVVENPPRPTRGSGGE